MLKTIIVDDLDRVSPCYAIKFLETIKIIFNTKNVVFLVMVDKEQLCRIVQKHYGFNEEESAEYLDKFFDFEIKMPISEDFNRKLVEESFAKAKDEDNCLIEVICLLSKVYDLTARQIIKTCHQIKILLGGRDYLFYEKFALVSLYIFYKKDRSKYEKLLNYYNDEASIARFYDSFDKTFFGDFLKSIKKLKNLPDEKTTIYDRIKNLVKDLWLFICASDETSSDDKIEKIYNGSMRQVLLENGAGTFKKMEDLVKRGRLEKFYNRIKTSNISLSTITSLIEHFIDDQE